METNKKTCCVFGHRKVAEKNVLREKLMEIIEQLIISENVDTFLVGSRSEFDDICREILSVKKEKYPHIQRVYVRGEYPDISEDYKNYLLKSCEDTYFPKRARNAGKAAYVERNYEMIDKSYYCICYYDENYAPPRRRTSKKDLMDYQPKSGTTLAYTYAVRKGKKIINLFCDRKND